MEHRNLDFDNWWGLNKNFYEENKISKEEFKNYKFKNGFNKGDIFVVKKGDIKKGDVIVYNNLIQNTPIIHRVIDINENIYMTKGDNVAVVQNFEKNINKEQIFGEAIIKIPYLGWVKVWFNNLINSLK